jgi:hypothetical protein
MINEKGEKSIFGRVQHEQLIRMRIADKYPVEGTEIDFVIHIIGFPDIPDAESLQLVLDGIRQGTVMHVPESVGRQISEFVFGSHIDDPVISGDQGSYNGIVGQGNGTPLYPVIFQHTLVIVADVYDSPEILGDAPVLFTTSGDIVLIIRDDRDPVLVGLGLKDHGDGLTEDP